MESLPVSAGRLRFGVLIGGNGIAAAHARSIEQLLAPGHECALVIITDGPLKSGIVDRLVTGIFPPAPWSAPLPAACRTAPQAGAREVDRIRAMGLDFILNCTTAPAATELSGTAAHGVWSWSYGAGANHQPCLLELSSGTRHVPVTLEQIGPPGRVLERGVVNTDPTSYRATLHTAMAAGIDFPALCARRLSKGLPVTHAGGVPNDRRSLGLRPSGRATLRLAWAWARSQVRLTVLSETWNVGIVNAPISAFLVPGYRPEVRWLPVPDGERFYADPFVLPRDTGFQLLVEEFDYPRYQGYITAITRDDEKADRAEVLIDEGVHMSYPFPLRHGDDWYCIPERSLSRSVSLYRLDRLTSHCERVQTLIEDFAAVDPTVFEHDGLWWLFCTSLDDLADCKLYVWYARELFGPWVAHAMNPVKCDVRSSRPGGTPFWFEGSLYRPAQDSSESYGGALTINRVLRLTVDEFVEEPVVHINPIAGPYSEGLHTLAGDGAVTVLDGKRMAFLPRSAVRRLRYKLGKLTRAITGRPHERTEQAT